MEGFSKIELLINHLTDHHLHLKCSICLQKFLSEKLLNLHMTKVHLKTNYQRNSLSSINQVVPVIQKVESISVKSEINDCFVLLERYNDEEITKSIKSSKCKIEVDSDDQNFDCHNYTSDECISTKSKPSKSNGNENGNLSIRKSRQIRKIFSKYYLNFKSYTCDFCKKTFTEKAQLRRHVRHHVRVQCSLCSSSLNLATLHRHLKTIHNSSYKKFQCDYCTKSYSERYYLKMHMNEHNNTNEYKCEFCNELFSTKMSYQHHCNRHKKYGFENKQIEYVCDICNEKFDRRNYFRRHMQTIHKKNVSNLAEQDDKETSINFEHVSLEHGMELDFVKQFNGSNNEIKNVAHQSTTSSQRINNNVANTKKNKKRYGMKKIKFLFKSYLKFDSYSCDICSRSFKIKKRLAVHIKYHMQRQCPICLKSVSFGYLSRHIRKHKQNNERYQCNHCSKSYSDQYALAEHMNEHDNKIVYKCDFCKIKFPTKSSYRTHLARHKKWGMENKPIEFVCKICKQIFDRIDYLKAHTNRMHKKANDATNSNCVNNEKQELELALQRVSKFSSLSIRKVLPNVTGELNKSTSDSSSKIFESNVDADGVQQVEDKNNATNATVINKTKSSTKLLPLTNAAIKNGFKCSTCDKTFFSKLLLRRHQKTHEEKKFVCVICSKSFYYRFRLNKHLFSHSGPNKQYTCIMCKGDFKTPILLDNHIRTQHL